jgi:hypothetical protein
MAITGGAPLSADKLAKVLARLPNRPHGVRERLGRVEDGYVAAGQAQALGAALLAHLPTVLDRPAVASVLVEIILRAGLRRRLKAVLLGQRFAGKDGLLGLIEPTLPGPLENARAAIAAAQGAAHG